jgi:predicted amidophosphoribosyltransferase
MPNYLEIKVNFWVCRGEVFGFSYICKCGANYCENCARALANLENICWACDAPIDYSKPVKHYKEKDEIAMVDKKQ